MIDFLSPKLLFALFGMGIPVLIHFLGRKKLKKIPFSSTRWLKALQSRTMRRLKVKQWILLVLRCLVILFLVLAFARPTVRRSGGDGNGNAAASAVIVVDRSMSMRAGDRFAEAQDRGRAILDLLGPGDAFSLVWTVDGSVRTPESTERMGSIRTTEESIRNELFAQTASFGRGDPFRNIEESFRMPGQSAFLNREVYLISDFQASELVRQPDSTRSGMPPGTLFLLPVTNDEENIAVIDAGCENALLQPGMPLRFFAQVRHFGRKTVEDLLVRVFLDSTVLSQRTVTLEPGASERVVFDVPCDRTGWVAGSVRIENDPCQPDNERFFVLHVPDRIRTLIVGQSNDDTRSFRLALQPDTDLRPLFDVEVRHASGSWVDALNDADVVFFAHVPVLGSMESGALLSFLRNGGGVFLSAGDNVDAAVLNSRFLGPAAGLSWTSVSKEQESLNGQNRKPGTAEVPGSDRIYGLGDADWGHPLFDGVFERGQENASGLRVHRRVICRGTNQKPILRFQDGETLLAEATVGQGRLLILTSGVQETWSNLASSALFVPMIIRSALFLSRSAEGRDAGLVGNRIEMPLDRLRNGPYGVMDPTGREIFLEPEKRDGRYRLELDKPDVPGIYRWISGEVLLGLSAVNTDPRESDLGQVNDGFWKKQFPEADLSFVDRTEELRTAVMQKRYGRELWRECLGLGALFLLAEMLVILWKTPSARESKSKIYRSPFNSKSGPS